MSPEGIAPQLVNGEWTLPAVDVSATRLYEPPPEKPIDPATWVAEGRAKLAASREPAGYGDLYLDTAQTIGSGVIASVANMVPDMVNGAVGWTEQFLHQKSGAFGRLDPWYEVRNGVAQDIVGDIRAVEGGLTALGPLKFGAAAGRLGTGAPSSMAAKISFAESANNIVDKTFGIKAGQLIADNPVASAYYARLQKQGTSVVFINDSAMSDMAFFEGQYNKVTINLSKHSSAEEIASTIVHESTHQGRYFKDIPLGNQYEEYLALRNEEFFATGARPSIDIRRQIWVDAQQIYPHLPQGRSPFGGQQ
ncbi:hypothetical protein [Andreprevotia chitinilytica]|uniref:hypothetical protein n=1 Tax=Andreprevotia chitinilytica TaxID=396808 RepID=UPI00054CFF17|nr:hypothetical protein [Andreprevotia chitinilytica]